MPTIYSSLSTAAPYALFPSHYRRSAPNTVATPYRLYHRSIATWLRLTRTLAMLELPENERALLNRVPDLLRSVVKKRLTRGWPISGFVVAPLFPFDGQFCPKWSVIGDRKSSRRVGYRSLLSPLDDAC